MCEDVQAAPVPRKVPRLNEYQRSILQRSFAVQRYPNKTVMKELALQTGLHEVQVLQWFVQNRPTGIKRSSKLMENHPF